MKEGRISKLNECRIKVGGKREFLAYIRQELNQLGFSEVSDSEIAQTLLNRNICVLSIVDIAELYLFDFINGAGAIVMFPEDDRDWLEKENVRVWVAEYMVGYCAFWNVDGCDWLQMALPAIKENATDETAMKTAANMGALIAANIVSGRDVKHYPRFYLVKSVK